MYTTAKREPIVVHSDLALVIERPHVIGRAQHVDAAAVGHRFTVAAASGPPIWNPHRQRP